MQVPHVLSAAVVSVGGSPWNRATARRLECEYQDAKPAVRIAARADDPVLVRLTTLLLSRGLPFEPVKLVDMEALWRGWHQRATDAAKLLQLATADELGGRLSEKTAALLEPERIIEAADWLCASIGGYAGVKAFVRAKWEVTQGALDKARVRELAVYLPTPARRLVRDGAIVTSLRPQFGLKLIVPRTAVLDIEGERAIVVSTAWKSVERVGHAHDSLGFDERAGSYHIRKGFDPNEPRDEHGRWTDGGGDGEGSEGSGSAPKPSGEGQPSPAKPAGTGTQDSGGRDATASGPYSVTSAGPSKGSGTVSHIYRPTGPNKVAFEHVGITPLTFHEIKPKAATDFRDAIKSAKEATSFGAAVEVHTPEQYRDMRTFVTPDKKAGFALDGDNIVSVFKHPDSEAKGFAGSALALATQLGGRRLDAFDTVLPRLYSEAGFRAVARLPFNEKYAPPGWDYQKFGAYNGGKPDVVFMVYDPQHPHEYGGQDGKKVETYEQGVAAQQAALAALDSAHASKPEKPAEAPTTSMTQMELWPDKFPAIPPPKDKLELDDFQKSAVKLDADTVSDPEKQKKFLDTWNAYVHEAPEAFKNEFLGGIPGTMKIDYDWDGHGDDEYKNEMTMTGKLYDKDDAVIGEYTRTINFLDNKASSDYFKLNRSAQKSNVGKQLLAANVAMYQKLGLDEVEVHADIDVGGYAWAKYGYVPSDESWSDLQGHMQEQAGSAGYTPESWDEMSSDQQDAARDAWKRDTFDEFYDSEVENWRDSGGDLDQAKTNLADADWSGAKWANDAIDKARNETEGGIPYSNEQILDSLVVEYESRHGDGRDDPTITVDETALPDGDKFTDAMRENVEDGLIKAFNDKAERDAPDVDPPDSLKEGVDDFQNDSWDNMSDRDKFRWAEEHGHVGEQEGSGDVNVDEDVRELIDSDDPKAVWAIADSSVGKDLLLGSDWYGSLNLHDRESMDRFNAYVGKAKGSQKAQDGARILHR